MYNREHEEDREVQPLANPRDDVPGTLLGVLVPLGDPVLGPQLLQGWNKMKDEHKLKTWARKQVTN